MSRIFICYRRRDDGHAAGRLRDFLARHFDREQVFFDNDAIKSGAKLRKTITERLAQVEVLLVVIGSKWLSKDLTDGNSRLDDPQDYVRLEIETAFRQKTPVVPVLIDGAEIPNRRHLPASLHNLCERRAFQIHQESFDWDAGELSSWLDKVVSANWSAAVKLNSTGFIITIRQRREIHKLTYFASFGVFGGELSLDDKKIAGIVAPQAQKDVRFRIVNHPNTFRLKFKKKLSGDYEIELSTSRRRILSYGKSVES